MLSWVQASAWVTGTIDSLNDGSISLAVRNCLPDYPLSRSWLIMILRYLCICRGQLMKTSRRKVGLSLLCHLSSVLLLLRRSIFIESCRIVAGRRIWSLHFFTKVIVAFWTSNFNIFKSRHHLFELFNTRMAEKGFLFQSVLILWQVCRGTVLISWGQSVWIAWVLVGVGCIHEWFRSCLF